MKHCVVIILALIVCSVSLDGQRRIQPERSISVEKPTPETAVPSPDMAALLRENETLKRERVKLLEDIRSRDMALMLASREKEFIIKDLTLDREEVNAKTTRCGVLEAQLREVEKPATEAKFDCETMTFK